MSTITYRAAPYAWSCQQIELLETNQLDKLDTNGLYQVADYFINRNKILFQENLRDILVGLVKQDHYKIEHEDIDTLQKKTKRVKNLIDNFPSLKILAKNELDMHWQGAVDRAANELASVCVGIPKCCPYTVDQIFPGLSKGEACILMTLKKQLRLLKAKQYDKLNVDSLLRVAVFIRQREDRKQVNRLESLLKYCLAYGYSQYDGKIKEQLIKGMRRHHDAVVKYAKADPSIVNVHSACLAKQYSKAWQDVTKNVPTISIATPKTCPWSLDDILDPAFIDNIKEKP